MDNMQPSDQGGRLERRFSELEMAVWRESENNARLIHDLSSKVQQLAQVFQPGSLGYRECIAPVAPQETTSHSPPVAQPGNVSHSTPVTQTGNMSLSTPVTQTGNMSLSTPVTQTGNMSLFTPVTQTGNMSLFTPVTQTGNMSLSTPVTQTGNMSLSTPVTQTGNMSLSTPVTQTGNMSLSTPVTQPGNVSHSPPVTQTGTMSHSTPVTQTGNMSHSTPVVQPGNISRSTPVTQPGNMSHSTPVAQTGNMSHSTPVAQLGNMSHDTPVAQLGNMTHSTPVTQAGYMSHATLPGGQDEAVPIDARGRSNIKARSMPPSERTRTVAHPHHSSQASPSSCATSRAVDPPTAAASLSVGQELSRSSEPTVKPGHNMVCNAVNTPSHLSQPFSREAILALQQRLSVAGSMTSKESIGKVYDLRSGPSVLQSAMDSITSSPDSSSPLLSTGTAGAVVDGSAGVLPQGQRISTRSLDQNVQHPLQPRPRPARDQATTPSSVPAKSEGSLKDQVHREQQGTHVSTGKPASNTTSPVGRVQNNISAKSGPLLGGENFLEAASRSQQPSGGLTLEQKSFGAEGVTSFPQVTPGVHEGSPMKDARNPSGFRAPESYTVYSALNVTAKPSLDVQPFLKAATGTPGQTTLMEPAVETAVKHQRYTEDRLPPLTQEPPVAPPQTTQLSNASSGNRKPSASMSSRILGSGNHDAQAEDLLRYLGIGHREAFHATVVRALTEEHPSPRAVTAQTVLCLDCSPSIGTQGLSQMKTAALAFVAGIEEVAERYGLDENLGVVTFGPSTEVVQHLTIDYQAVREAIEASTLGGVSPLLEAVIVTLASIIGRGGALKIGHVYKVRPRVVFFTDGKSTKSNPSRDVEAWTPAPAHRKVSMIRLFNRINRKSTSNLPNPFVWVPVGDADKEFLRSLAHIGKGRYVEPDDIYKECSHYRFHDSVARGYLCAKKMTGTLWDLDTVETLMAGIVGSLEGLDKAELVRAVKEKLDEQEPLDFGPTDFNRIFEHPELPPVGTRVARGPDWRYGEQDGGCAGTIIGHCPKSQGVVRVMWDHGGHNRYRYREKRDVIIVDTPRHLAPGETIAVGMKVKRGPDWNKGNEDGGHGSVGVVVRAKTGKVRVRWPAGNMEAYAWQADGKHYLTLLDPGSEEEGPDQETIPKQLWESEDRAETPSAKKALWQWSATGQDWQAYDDVTQGKLEEQFQRRPTSTCVIRRDGDRRVIFRTNVEMKVGEPSVKCYVRRIMIDK